MGEHKPAQQNPGEPWQIQDMIEYIIIIMS